MNAAMLFDSDALEPMYKLLIGKSGESNALWITKKMNIQEKVLQKAQNYMENKTYDLERVRENKIKKPTALRESQIETYGFERGDRVKLLEYDDFGIVYEKKDQQNNVSVFFKNEVIKQNVKRIVLEGKAADYTLKDMIYLHCL